jgi:hypothetical protein
MQDLTELDALLKGWRIYIEATSQTPDGLTRDAGFRSALIICADQLRDAIERTRTDAE